MLTASQYAALKADIALNFAAVPRGSDGDLTIAEAYNAAAAPAFRVWRTDVPTADVKRAISWTEFIGRTAGERDAFALMVSNHIVNAADTNVRQGFSDIFSGPSGVTSRTNLSNISKRDARRIEKLLATGTGTEAAPATMGYEGTISYQDVQIARELP